MATVTLERAHSDGGLAKKLTEPGARLCAAWALLAVLAVLCWQAATVHFSYGGNWTALFCTGALQPAPPELAATTYIFPASNGYDGQFYRYLAHDPWFQKGFWKFQDTAAVRSYRILVPAMAWILAGGQPRLIDGAYVAAILVSIFAGVYWLGRYAASHGRNPAWGLGFVLLPATLVSIDRLTIDVALCALCAGFAWYAKRGSNRRLYIVLLLAPLVRETGLLLVAAYCLHAASKRRWRRSLLFATAALPALAWYVIVLAHVPRAAAGEGTTVPFWFFRYPLVGIVMRLFRPEPYPWGPLLVRAVQAADAISLCAFLAMLARAAWSLRRRPFDHEQWATLVFVGFVLVVSAPGFWRNIYGYGRTVSPLVLFAALPALTGRSPRLAAPVLFMDLRIAAQVAPQAWNIVRGMF
jgi:hypothetical protein